MARLYSNENFPQPVVEMLRAIGHDVLTTKDAGWDNAAIPDDGVLAYAVAEGRAVLTLNRLDFMRLHLSNPDHRGIVVCTFNPDFAGQAQAVHRVLSQAKNLDGLLLRVNRGS
jgi:predicted nuclease of predicted toxin-antitoxin system